MSVSLALALTGVLAVLVAAGANPLAPRPTGRLVRGVSGGAWRRMAVARSLYAFAVALWLVAIWVAVLT